MIKHFFNLLLAFLVAVLVFPASGQDQLPDQKLPELIPYRKGDLWGFAKPGSKEIVIQPRYHEVKFFQENLSYVRLNNSWGIIDKNGQEIIKPEYKSLSPLTNGHFIAEKGRKFGAMNRQGELVIPIKYTSLYWVGNLLAAGIGWGEKLYFPRQNDIIQDSRKFVLLNLQGKVLSKKYDGIDFFSEGLAAVNKGEKWAVSRYGFAVEEDEGLWGFIDTTGREVHPVNLLNAKPFKEGRALVRPLSDSPRYGFITPDMKPASRFLYSDGRSYDQGLAQVKGDLNWGVIDLSGNTVVEHHYASMYPFNQFGLAMVQVDAYILRKTVISDGYWRRNHGAINRQGQTVVPILEWYVDEFKPDGFAKVWVEEYKLGRVHYSGKLVLPPIYKYIRDIETGFVVANQQNQGAYFDKEGEVVVPFGRYDHIGILKENRMLVSKGEFYGYINKQGKEVIPLHFKLPVERHNWNYLNFNNGMAGFVQGAKWGFIDSTGKIGVPPKYVRIRPFEAGLGTGIIEELPGKEIFILINKAGKEIPLPYGQYPNGSSSPGLHRISFQRKGYGFMNREGEMVLPLKYNLNFGMEESWNFRNGLIMVLFSPEEKESRKKQGLKVADEGQWYKKGYVDINGVEYFED